MQVQDGEARFSEHVSIYTLFLANLIHFYSFKCPQSDNNMENYVSNSDILSKPQSAYRTT